PLLSPIRIPPRSPLFPYTTLFRSNALSDRWPELVTTAGVRRVAVEAMTLPHLVWEGLRKAAPTVELVPIEGWVEDGRQHKEVSEDRKSTRLNSSHLGISYAVFCLK